MCQPIHPIKSLNILQTKSDKGYMKQLVLIFSHTHKKIKLKVAEFLSNDDPHRKQHEEKSVSKNNLKLDMLWLLRCNVTPEKLTMLWPE